MVTRVATAEPEGKAPELGEIQPAHPTFTSCCAHTAPISQRALLRQSPAAGAVCVNRACTDLCGGRWVTGVPTATFSAMITAGGFLGAFALYLSSMCPTISLGDSAELLLVGLDLDVAHAPGYPPFAMLLRLFAALPVGGPGFRAGLFAACAGAGAVAVLYNIARFFRAPVPAALFGAALFAVSPWLMLQSGSLEKYGFAVCLSALCLRIMLDPGAPWLLGTLVFGLALSHHPIAVFLLPVFGLFLWRHARDGRSARALVLGAVVFLLPMSQRVLYPPVRAEALRTAGESGSQPINWGEPCRVRTLWKYLRLSYYAHRFDTGSGSLAKPTLGEHVASYPAHLGWPGLAFAAAGAWFLGRRRRPEALALAGVWLVSFPFNLRFISPPSVVADYHQVELLILALCSALGAGWIMEIIKGRGRTVLVAILGAWIVLTGLSHRASCDLSRLFMLHDFTAAQFVMAPRGAMLASTWDLEFCTMKYFKEVLGRRDDLVLVQIPFMTSADTTYGRLRRQPWAEGVFTGGGSVLAEREGTALDRRLILAACRHYCLAGGGFSAALLPQEIFEPYGIMFLAGMSRCSGAGNAEAAVRVMRGASERALYFKASGLKVNWLRRSHWAAVYLRLAGMRNVGLTRRIALAHKAVALDPESPNAWLVLGACLWNSDRTGAAEDCFRRAISTDPGCLPARWNLVEHCLEKGRPDGAVEALRDALGYPGLRFSRDSGEVMARLDRGDLTGAVGLARMAFAGAALDQAEKSPFDSAWADRRPFLYTFAANLAPEWDRAQAECVRHLQARACLDQAMPYLDRLRLLGTKEVRLFVKQGVGYLVEGKADRALPVLLHATRMDPANSLAWLGLGQANLMLGRRGEARREFKTFLTITNDTVLAEKVGKLVADLGK